MALLRLIFLILIPVLLVAIACDEVPPPPDHTPAPTAWHPTATPDPNATRDPLGGLSPGSFPLNEPIPTSLAMTVGSREVVMPAGSQAVLVHNEAPPVDALTGKPVITAGPHPTYWRIERGATYLLIDDETGEVFESNIEPEDRDDFATFLDS